MKPLRHSLLSAVLAWLALIAATAAPANAPSLVIVSPRADQPHAQSTVSVSVRVVDGPDEPLEVRIESLGVTHRVTTNPRAQPPRRPGQPAGVPAYDGYWFMPPGPATITLSVWRPGASEPLIPPQTVSFTVTAPAAKDLAATTEIVRQRISNPERSRQTARRTYERAVWNGQRGSKPEWVREQADSYLSHRHAEFRDRISAYCTLANAVYEAAGNAGDALRTLRLADEIYAAEGRITVSGPHLRPVPAMYLPKDWTYAPAHFQAFTTFYLRRQALELATVWKVKEAEWYRAQADFHAADVRIRQESLKRAAFAYREIGSWYVLFANDPESRAKWERKAAEVPVGPAAPPTGINLLDTR